MRSRSWLAVSAATAIAALPTVARAHSAGQPRPGCLGCHGNQSDYAISVGTNPASFSPGDAITVTVTIAPGFGAEAGVFIAANAGTLGVLGGQGLGAVPAGLTHTSPKPLSGGAASFSFAWTAPPGPGAVRFDVSTLVADGNGNSGGDSANSGAFDFVYGCAPATYFEDFDGDGYGDTADPLTHCADAIPTGYAAAGGDCNDAKDTTYPDAIEYCNQVDDDCDGIVDDDAIPIVLYPDSDDDGYYGNADLESGETIMGCVPTPNYAAEPGDCDTDDPQVNPGATEVCNLIDDNCDGRKDEYVRPRCGEGWCQREAFTCADDTCVPGDPRAEECNLLDDDCDGLVDEDSPCPAGQSCVAAKCVDTPAPAAPASGSSDCTVSGQSSPWLAAGVLFGLGALLARRRRQALRGSRTAR